jgi:hypothetical protein
MALPLLTSRNGGAPHRSAIQQLKSTNTIENATAVIFSLLVICTISIVLRKMAKIHTIREIAAEIRRFRQLRFSAPIIVGEIEMSRYLISEVLEANQKP